MIVRRNVTKNADLYGIHGWKVVASLKDQGCLGADTQDRCIHGWKVVASLKVRTGRRVPQFRNPVSTAGRSWPH